MITTHITINLTSQVSPQLIQAVQGDTGRSICFKLADFTIPAGAAATYYIQKPSGEAIYNSATISGNEITCELTAQSLAEIGENPMQVRISADGEIVTSFDVILLVRPFRGIGAIESGTEINIFDQAVEKAAEDFQEQAEEIVQQVIESIPADYTELTEEVDELNERLTNKDYLDGYIWHDGYVNSSGVIETSDIRKYSDLILCPAGSTCKYVAESDHVSINGISFYDKTGTYISGKSNSGTMGTEQTATAPATAYFCRLSMRSNRIAEAYVHFNVAANAKTVIDLIKKAEDDTAAAESSLLSSLPGIVYNMLFWHDGYFVNSSGAISENSARAYSDLIVCPAGTICKYIGDTSNGSINGISFYDKVGTYISGVANNGALGTEVTVTAPAGSWYCRLTTRTSMKDTTYIKMGRGVIADTFSNLATYVDVESKYPINKQIASAESILTISGAIDGNGAFVSNNDYLCSDYIEIKTGDVIHYTMCQYLTLSAIAIYNTSKVMTSNVLGNGTTTPTTGTYTAVADGFIRVSCWKASLSMCEFYFGGSLIEELSQMSAGEVFYCGANRTLTTLKAGLEAATAKMDSTLYVDPGTYDLVQEFGESWFDNLDGSLTLIGLQLKNRVHVIFSPNSKVVSHYTGNNQYAQSLYSPFNAGQYGFTLENLTLECSRCRYAIHDERNGGTEIYKSSYINCNVYIDNSENDYWSSRCGIGGGLGANAEVMINSCVWGSDNPDTANARNAVYYHLSNSHSDSNHRAFVTIKNCYFKTGCIQLDPGYLTTSAENSTFVITNNSFSQVYNGADSQGVFHSSLDLNTSDLYEWNNEIRS